MVLFPVKQKFSISKKTLSFYLLSFLIFVLISTAFCELVLRISGYHPNTNTEKKISVSGGSLFIKDSVLGYTTFPGSFEITLPSGYVFTITNDSSGNRITYPDAKTNSNDGVSIGLFGCSYTHGWSLNDSQTFAWKLQSKMPQFDITNYAKSGYSNVQTYMQLLQLYKENRMPSIVIVIYASFHNERNTSSARWRKNLVTFNKLGPLHHPVAYLRKDSLKIKQQKLIYKPILLSRILVTANLLDDVMNQLTENKEHQDDVTKRLFIEMNQLINSAGSTLLVAGITKDKTTKSMLQFLETKGINTADISIDLSLPGYTNEPYDSHPSSKANNRYAKKLVDFILSL